ncbi:tyrosine-type recombinase/integrase [Mycobacteroides abscessus]|uniref:tyrosine-type recombinase/integrase n=1 Tax=Mycobacteroides abscessus TaxID=36809 RepID=UPI00092A81B8|nr:tyrosine-type recombinase/integrase [Mycobacteroides abscessus]MDO3336469.1 tyrosine-type recombinase/integrase [Mycobacteroides abscessus subsp. bolletii]QSM91452.1 tyrosine-type recombinase/integrase [Mycobacteroides abscessus subsp. bolletii]SIB92175.1 site-specific recombinase XerD [Mycobacteroides abscessus subsp. bolletii]SIJ24740.1 site-specific recombinase XerD [Mycobacteroides abscessus subsp. bolletii]SKS85360.1 site-specific recombinase XerD [Mycobacteroides abscessus subsp. boll
MVVNHESSPAPVATTQASADPLPVWFVAFLNDRQTRKPSAHTMKAYRQDFVAIATLTVGGGDPARLAISDITKDAMRAAFAAYARDHEAASIRRCWSTWNVLCTFLFTSELLSANPMALVGRPKLARSLPKALPHAAVGALLQAVADDVDSTRQTDWAERDLAIILTALLAGLRAEELRQADVGDVRTVNDGAGIIHVKGKGGKDRTVPVEADLLRVIEAYLDSRAIRFPDAVKRQNGPMVSGLARWPARAPLLVGRDGRRITRGTVQSRIKRAFKRAGPDAQPVPGAMVHGLRHTFATELANADVSVYTLMKLLGHDSMTTSQRYVTAAGTETRTAAAQNRLYELAAGLGSIERDPIDVRRQ